MGACALRDRNSGDVSSLLTIFVGVSAALAAAVPDRSVSEEAPADSPAVTAGAMLVGPSDTPFAGPTSNVAPLFSENEDAVDTPPTAVLVALVVLANSSVAIPARLKSVVGASSTATVIADENSLFWL